MGRYSKAFLDSQRPGRRKDDSAIDLCSALREQEDAEIEDDAEPVTVPRELLTTREMAERLQTKPSTLRDLARCQLVPAMRIGLEWRFDPGEVYLFLRRAGAPWHRPGHKPRAALADWWHRQVWRRADR